MNCCKEKDHHASQEDSCCKKEGKGGFFARLFGGKGKCACKEEAAQEKKCCKSHTAEKEMKGQCCRSKKHGTRNDVVQAGQIMLGILDKQIQGLSNDELVRQQGGVVNHPIWTMGHIAHTLNGTIMLLGGESMLNESWGKKFGTGSQPVADASAYPSAAELKQSLVNLHAKASQLYLSAPSELLRSRNAMEKFADMIPTTGGMVVFLMTAHMCEHLGQVSAWRRAMGLNPIF